eukprot:2175011-Rhodomonas_salina.1
MSEQRRQGSHVLRSRRRSEQWRQGGHAEGVVGIGGIARQHGSRGTGGGASSGGKGVTLKTSFASRVSCASSCIDGGRESHNGKGVVCIGAGG